jgi:hypothetical protein
MQRDIDDTDATITINDYCERLLREKRLPPEELPMLQGRAREILSTRVQLVIPLHPKLPDPDAFLEDLISIFHAIIMQVCIDASREIKARLESLHTPGASDVGTPAIIAEFVEIYHCATGQEFSGTPN